MHKNHRDMTSKTVAIDDIYSVLLLLRVELSVAVCQIINQSHPSVAR